MQTISAKVDPKLLTKASRLFIGNINGRIIEILQNSRRAGATHARIFNTDGFVTIHDNGSGIDDFQKLLDLGGSGWDEELEAGEDPAGVGLFCLAPNKIEIMSGSKKVIIDEDCWTGKPVDVLEDQEFITGTIIKFKDEEPWSKDLVEKHAVFAGIRVVVDGKVCHSMQFCSQESINYPEIGCRIEVVSQVSKYHYQWMSHHYQSKVLVNFHGQIVELDYWPSKTLGSIHVLVDLTEQTQARLMLPARTRLVEDEIFNKLKNAVEIEYYRYFQRQKEHSLYYDEYLRAKELGVELQEATPKYSVGVVLDEYSIAVEVVSHKDLRLCDCYLCFDRDLGDEFAQTNSHLLAALGRVEGKLFVPVSIQSGYMGYSWSKLPRVTSVKVIAGKERLRQMIVGYDLVCVESISIEVKTSDAQRFVSRVPMAVVGESTSGNCSWRNESVYVTEDARDELSCDSIWYHLGGCNEEGDSFDTQQYYVAKELEGFFNDLIGPHQQLRYELIKRVNRHSSVFGNWRKIEINNDGSILLCLKDGKTETVNPPK